MSVDVGSAVGYLDLDISGFLSSLREANAAAKEQTENISRSFSEKLTSIGESLKGVGTSLSKFVTVPITGAGTALLKFGSNFEKEMKNISAITGMEASELKQIEEGIRDIAYTTGTSQAALASSAKMVAEAGGDMKLMMAQLKAGNDLAIASQTDLGTTLDMVGSTMKTFGLEAESTQATVDSLASVTTLANTTLEEIGQAFTNVGGMAHNAGLSVDEVNAFLVTFANAGLKSGSAGTALNGVLRNLTAPTSAAQEALAALNVALYDNQGGSRDVMEVMKDLETALSGLTDEQRAATESVIFDSVSMKAWNNIKAEGVTAIKELSEELSGSVDAYDGMGQAAGMAAEQGTSFAATLKSLYPYLEELGKILLEKVQPYFEWFISLLKQGIKWIAELPDSVQTSIVVFGAFAAALGPVVLAVGALLTTIGGLIPVFTALITPVGAVIAAIVAFGATIYALWQTNDEFRDGVIGIWNELIEVFQAFYERASQILGDLGIDFSSSASFIQDVWEKFSQTIVPVVLWALEKIVEGTSFALDTILTFMEEFSENFTGDWSNLSDVIYAIWLSLWETLQPIYTQFVEWLFQQLTEFAARFATWMKDFAINSVMSYLYQLWDDIKVWATEVTQGFVIIGSDIVKGVWQGMLDAKDWFYNQVSGFFSGIVGNVKRSLGIHSPSTVFADQIGKWLPPGIVEGFEDALPSAMGAIDTLLHDGVDAMNASDIGAGYIGVGGFSGTSGSNSGSSGTTQEQMTPIGNGNTYIFNSPEPITEAVARREFEQTQRKLAFGF